jgi:hypothetical protein
MSNLVPFNNNDGLELVVDTNTGETFASIRAVARMTDKDDKTIRNYVSGRIKGADKMELKTTEIQTPGGLQAADLLNEKQIVKVIKRYKPALLEAFAEAGIRVFLQQLVGYNPNQVDVTQGLVNELYDTAKDKCFNDSHADYAIHGSLQYQKKLDPQLKATVQISMIMANLRLECEADHSMIGEKCENIVNKQFRHTQMTMEGIESVPDNCLPKAELRDKQKALTNNPSSKKHLLPTVNSLTSSQLVEATRIDLSTLLDPTIYGNIEQSKKIKCNNNQTTPALPEGYVIDIPLNNIH